MENDWSELDLANHHIIVMPDSSVQVYHKVQLAVDHRKKQVIMLV